MIVAVEDLTALKIQAEKFAEKLQSRLKNHSNQVVYLHGDLGAGKTTFTQYLAAALNIQEHIKSPTYTLVESYQSAGLHFHHMDLYRLSEPEELEYLALEDLPLPAIFMIEWPSKGQGWLMPADIEIQLSGQDTGKRQINFQYNS